MRVTILFALLAVFATQTSAAPRFPMLDVLADGKPEPHFQLSAAAASPGDPVVVSVQGRELRASDREHRVGLQKYWLQQNVPAGYAIVSRSLIVCPRRQPKDIGACDEYLFSDPAGKHHAYYFYVGNWP